MLMSIPVSKHRLLASLAGLIAIIVLSNLTSSSALAQTTASDALIGHWKLNGNASDSSGNNRHANVVGDVDFKIVGPSGEPGSAVQLSDSNGYLEVPAELSPQLSTGDFTIAAWVNCPASDDGPGDIVSQYDSATRRGFQLTLKTQSVTTSQASNRQLQFGIDDNRDTGWIDCGQPGDALLGFGMTSFNGNLYVGTCEPGLNQTGHVYRYAGGTEWTDLGAPDKSNSVTSLCVFNNQLYVGTGKYRVAGSSLPESENQTFGGRVFCYGGDNNWIDCGKVPDTEMIGSLCVFQGQLYATSLYAPAGLYRYDGNKNWLACGVPQGKRVVALGTHRNKLYATSYDEGSVFQFDGTDWVDCGIVGDNTQTYDFATYRGNLYVATWPSGKVYRFDGIENWADVGRLGEELEVMGMLVHNGRFIAGTLPLAQVYSYEGGESWKLLDQLDKTPDVKYRRAWAMAEHAGRAYCSTLPSGKIFSYQAGLNAMAPTALPAGWQHVTAVRDNGILTIYVNGKPVARSESTDKPFDLSAAAPFRIGFGSNDHFNGAVSDVRLYSQALTPATIQTLLKTE